MHINTSPPSQDHSSKPRGLSWRQMLGSAMAAAIGVQSQANKERDFTYGDIRRFFALGIATTAAFVFVMMGIVSIAIP